MAFQEKEQALNNEAQSMRQRIDALEKEREVSGVSQTFQDKSQRAGITMSQYED